MATIKGDSRNNELTGTRKKDFIYGYGGNDEIEGRAGNDKIYGGIGRDEIDGGSDNDYLDGGKGNDEIDGGAGNDKIFGKAGNDTIEGGSGNDSLWGGTGKDVFEYDEDFYFGTDMIMDYESNKDVVDLDSLTYETSVVGDDFIISTDQGNITLKNSASKTILLNTSSGRKILNGE